MTAPTDRQRELLGAIVRTHRAKGFPGTFRELGEQLGLGPTRVCQLVVMLEEQGFVTRRQGGARTLVITDAGRKEAR